MTRKRTREKHGSLKNGTYFVEKNVRTYYSTKAEYDEELKKISEEKNESRPAIATEQTLPAPQKQTQSLSQNTTNIQNNIYYYNNQNYNFYTMGIFFPMSQGFPYPDIYAMLPQPLPPQPTMPNLIPPQSLLTCW
jgi:hypothetical protein